MQLEYRIHLRNELMACGFAKVIAKLKTWAKAEFQDIIHHVELFEHRSQSDHSEFIEGLDVGLTDIDMDDPHAILTSLIRAYDKDPEGAGYVSSILQHLLIPTRLADEVSR